MTVLYSRSREFLERPQPHVTATIARFHRRRCAPCRSPRGFLAYFAPRRAAGVEDHRLLGSETRRPTKMRVPSSWEIGTNRSEHRSRSASKIHFYRVKLYAHKCRMYVPPVRPLRLLHSSALSALDGGHISRTRSPLSRGDGKEEETERTQSVDERCTLCTK